MYSSEGNSKLRDYLFKKLYICKHKYFAQICHKSGTFLEGSEE
jgi:hypothetical protein